MFKIFRNISFPKIFGARETRSAVNSSSQASLLSGLFGHPTRSGISVNRVNILGDSSVWAALRIISNGIASLPFEVYRENDGMRSRATNHPVHYLVNKEPNPLHTSFAFRQSLIFQTWLKGDGYVRIIRNDRTAQPMQLVLLQSENVELYESINGLPAYYMVRGKGIAGTIHTHEAVRMEDMIHIKVMSTNGVTGIDLIHTHSGNLSVNLASAQFGEHFFGGGAHVDSVIETEMDWDDDQAINFAKRFKSHYAGLDNIGKPIVLDLGMKYKKIGLNPSEAMMIETRKHQVEETSRIFGIPSHMLSAMDKATFNNIEVMSLDFVKNTLRPICVMIEQEFDRKLFTEAEKRSGQLYTRFNLDSLMRGATKDRFDAYAIALQNKIMNANEVRALENLNPVEGGEVFENPMIQVKIPEPVI